MKKVLLIFGLFSLILFTSCEHPSHIVLDAGNMTIYSKKSVDKEGYKFAYYVKDGRNLETSFAFYTNDGSFQVGDKVTFIKAPSSSPCN